MKNTKTKGIMVIAIIALIGAGTYAFAGWEKGYGYHGIRCGNNGSGWGGYCDGSYGIQGELDDEKRKDIQESRKAFYENTKDLRATLYEKELALKSEFAKKNPDPKKARGLQKEISKLESEIDQKRLEYMISIKSINPELGRGNRNIRKGTRQGRGFSQKGRCW